MPSVRRLYLISTLLVLHVVCAAEVISPSAGQSIDPHFELAKANARFILVLYDRVESALLQERRKYDEQLLTLESSVEKDRSGLQDTRQKRILAEAQLDQMIAEERTLQRSIKTVDPKNRQQLLAQIQILENTIVQKANEISKLKEQEEALEASFRFSSRRYFADNGGLNKERDRINNELWSMFRRKDEWEKSKSPKDYNELKDLLTRKAAARGFTCSVTVISKTESGETTDASIRYQTPEQRQYNASPRTAKCPTRCTDQMKADRYYVWVERGNRATSDRNQIFVIGNETETITLIENPN